MRIIVENRMGKSSSSTPRTVAALSVGAVGLAFLLAGCKKQDNAYVPPPPPTVTVASPVKKVVPQTMEFTGRTRGIEAVQVRARVKGFLAKKHAEGGKRVKQGDLLFEIDPRTFQATVNQAKAEVGVREAQLKLAEVTVERTKSALAANAISKQEVDKAIAERDAAAAQLDLAKASLKAAELDLEFTQIRAPISGRLGIITISEGELLGATEATLLTTIINDSKVYASYDMTEPQVLEQRRRNQNRRPGEDGRPNLVIRLGLANEVGYPHEGAFDKGDNTVDSGTGTVRIEALFDNPDGTILPGSYVRVQAILGEAEAVLVPDVAVLADQVGRYVLVVGADDVVSRRNVVAGPVFDRMRRIDDGLSPDDVVVVNGVQRARPGAKITRATAAAVPAADKSSERSSDKPTEKPAEPAKS